MYVCTFCDNICRRSIDVKPMALQIYKQINSTFVYTLQEIVHSFLYIPFFYYTLLNYSCTRNIPSYCCGTGN